MAQNPTPNEAYGNDGYSNGNGYGGMAGVNATPEFLSGNEEIDEAMANPMEGGDNT